MKLHNKWTLNLSTLLLLPLCILIMNTTTVIMRYSKLFFYLILFLLVLILILRLQKLKGIGTISGNQKLWLICIGYAWCGMLYSKDYATTFEFCRPLTVYSLFAFILFSSNYYTRLLDWLWKLLMLGCATIYLNVAIPNLMTSYLSFIPSPAIMSTLRTEVAGHVYSGIFCDRATAAFAMNAAFAIGLSKIISLEKTRQKRKYTVLLLIIYISIFFTGKRTLSIIPLIMAVSYLLLSSKKGKKRNILLGVLVFVVAIFFVSVFYDVFAVYFTRDSSDILNGRGTILWPVAFEMFKERKLFGTGLNTFNSIIRGSYLNNLTLSSWGYHAHNIYIQLLGETGIIGCTLFFSFFATELYQSIKLIKKSLTIRHKYLILTSVFWQILWLVYGFTGNTLYYTAQLLLYLIGVAIVEECRNEIKKDCNFDFS